MTKFKISIHCGAVNTFVVEDHETKQEALNKYSEAICAARAADDYVAVGDVLINPAQITFVVVEELIETVLEPESETIEV